MYIYNISSSCIFFSLDLLRDSWRVTSMTFATSRGQFGSKCSVLLQAMSPLQRAGAFAAASPTQLKPRMAEIASCYRLFGWLFRGLV